jgi:hypothetical protein
MLGPTSETKLKWATGAEQLFTYYIFRANPGGAIAKFRWQIGPAIKARIKGMTSQIEKEEQEPASVEVDAKGES